MPLFALTTTSPSLNLAIEEHLLDRADVLGPTLLLWRNERCVVIGRHQNPWLECDLVRMRTDAVSLVRRISGGGAVYHDGGNTNFSFIAPAAIYDQERHFRVVIHALSTLGITAWKSPRNDLRVGDLKISGNAFRHSRGHSLHHGTLLVNADLDLLSAYLAPRPAQIQTGAIASVRSAVTNLADERPGLTHEELCDALARSFEREYGPDSAGPSEPSATDRFEPARLASSPEVVRRAGELASWEWVYGATPAFTRRVQADDVSAEIHVRRGRIGAVDGVSPVLAEVITGLRYDAAELLGAAVPADAASLLRAIAAGI